MLFWVSGLSSRISALEKSLKSGKPSSLPNLPADVGVPKRSLWQETPAQSVASPSQSFSPKPKTEAEAAEATAGWLNKIGVVALVLGIVFFFKYAIDQGWINEWTRVIIGFFVGALVVYLGELWKEKYGSRAHALSGGGVAILYFTIYAAYNFYHILAQPVAFVLMLAVAAMCVFLSFRYGSLTLGVLAFFGAFGSPIMLSTHRDQQIQLFVYLTVLNLAALLICLKRFWLELLFLGLFGTILDFGLWASNFSNYENTMASVVFALLTVLFLSIGASLLLRKYNESKNLPNNFESNLLALHLLAAGFYTFTSYFLLSQNYHDLLPVYALMGAVLFLFNYALVDRLEFKKINYGLSGAGASLLVLAAAWQYVGNTLGWVLLITSVFGIFLGLILKREELRVWALVILFLSLFKSIAEPYALSVNVFLFNPKFILLLANSAVMFLVAYLYGKSEKTEFESNAEIVLQYAASFTIWFGVSWEIVEYYRYASSDNARNLFLSFWWILYGVVLMVVGAVAKSSTFRKSAIVLFALSIVKVFLYDVQNLDTAYRIISFIVLGVILLSVSFAYQKNKEKITEFLGGERKGQI